MKDMHSPVDKLAWILLIVGGLNWGLVGLFDYNLVDSLFGMGTTLTKIIYTLVGLAGLYVLVFSCKSCMAGGKRK